MPLVERLMGRRTNDSDALASFVYARWRESRDAFSQLHDEWFKWYRRLRGVHWDKNRPGMSKLVINLAVRDVLTIASVLTDDKPRIHVIPRSDDMNEFDAQIRERVLQWVLDKNSWDGIVGDTAMNAAIYGNAFLEAGWNKRRGFIEISPLDPFQVYLDPEAPSLETSEWVIVKTRRSVDWVKRNFPKTGSDVTSDTDEIEELRRTQTPTRQVLRTGRPDAVSIFTFHERRDMGGTFPGRRIISTQSRVLLDEPNHLKLDQFAVPDNFPISHIRLVSMPNEPYGIGIVEIGEDTNQVVNYMASRIHDYIRKMGSGHWVIDNNSDVDVDRITNEEALLIEKNAGTEVQKIPPPPMPGAFLAFWSSMQVSHDVVTGLQEVSQGRRDPGVASGRAIIALQQAVQTKIRLMSRNLESGLSRFGAIVLSMIQQFMTQPQTIRISDPITGTVALPLNRPIALAATGDVIKRANDMSIGEFDVKISVSPALADSKQERRNEAIALRQLGAIDAEELLDRIEYPGREKVKARLRAAQVPQPEVPQGGIAGRQGMETLAQPLAPPEQGLTEEPIGEAAEEEILGQEAGRAQGGI